MKKNLKNKILTTASKTIELFAQKKANANCFGLMYEPKKPEVIRNNQKKQ